ncbi:MAG: urea ABC transporter permease subunit UrtB, partial [Pseudomonadota bacterium]
MLLLRALILLVSFMALPVQAATLEELVAQLPEGKFDERAEVIDKIATTGDPRAVPLLEALSEGELQQMKKTDAIVRVVREGKIFTAFDPLTGAEIGEIGRRDARKIRVNNRLRRQISNAVAVMTLQAPDREVRLEAAAQAFKSGDPGKLPALRAALELEEDAEVRSAFEDAVAAATLGSDAGEAEKIAALELLAGRADQQALSLVTRAAEGEGAVAAAAQAALEQIENARFAWGLAQNVWYGLSLGSVLMLAAIGLA